MIKLYFTLFYQRIKQRLSLFILNFIGYTLLLSVISLTTLFIYGELNYDNFKKKDRIYRMINSFTAGSKPAYTLNSTATILKDLKSEYPEIESIVNMFFVRDMDIKSAEKRFNQNVIFFEGDFLNTFTPDFIYGGATSINESESVCFITKSFSKNLFGRKNCLGENLTLFNKNDTVQVNIAGVINDFENTTCMQGNIFVKGEAGWNFYDDVTDLSFLLLKANSKIDKLNNIQAEEYEHNGINYKEGFFFQPVKEVYLKSGFLNFNFYPSGNLKLLIILFVALLLMLLCVIFNYNFMFIVIIKARVKEFSLKRILGLEKRKVLFGIITDSALFAFIAIVLAYVISKKAFYRIESLHVVLKNYSDWFNGVFITVSIIILIITITIPLLYYKTILKFHRLDRLKFSNFRRNKNSFGIIFLGIQIMVAFVLLAFSFMVKSQIKFAVHRNLGIKNRDLVIIENDLTKQEYDVLAEDLRKESIISGVTRIGKLPPSNFPQRMTRIKCKDDKAIITAVLFVDQNTLEILGVNYFQGQGFQNVSNYESYCVISRSLANQLNVNNIIGYEVKPNLKIAGIVEDISMVPVRKDNLPLIIMCNPELCQEILVSTQINNEKATKYISKIFDSIHGKIPQLTFYEDYLKSLYTEENFMLKYIVIFSTFTLLMVFLGFYFYSSSIIDLRSKEIVIRKIHGASFQDIIKLLVKEYLTVYFISFIIACLLFTYLTKIWLSGFKLHTDISLKHYLYPAIIIAVILLTAILNSVYKLAHKNIVHTLSNYR